MKKAISLLMGLSMAAALLAGCGNSASSTASGSGAAMSGSVSVVSREDGSGTRGAFIELFGVEKKDETGKKVDHTTDAAEITNSTAVMMTTVAGNKAAIGYVSLGSLNDSVKALSIDGAEATVENIKSGAYAIARPFNIATKGEVSAAAQDFIDFILSEQGQKVVEDNGYISKGSTGAFAGGKASGSVTVAGSSSVTPVMEKLKEAYEALNGGVTIEIQQNDSTTGMTSAQEGLCDIGMASRELKDSEKDAGLTAQVIAMDGIAVVVNNANPTTGLTAEQVCGIFTGDVTDWSEVAGA
jgi:phosphate transport system substrate-binding protein